MQGWYEDDESLAAKFDLARTSGVQGVCLWALDGVEETPETFRLIRDHLRHSP